MVGIGGSTPEYVRGRLVTEGYFSVLGVEPAISYDYWRRRFGGNTAVLGTAIHLHRTNLTIIGVSAPGFRAETVGQDPDLWVPMMMQPLAMPGRDWLREDLSQALEKVMWLHVFGRLRTGVTIAKAQAVVTVQRRVS